MNRSKQLPGILAVLSAALLLPAAAQVDGYVVKKGTGQKLNGKVRWRASMKQYEIKMAGKQALSSVPAAQVAQVRVRPPEGLENAARAVKGGSYTGAHILKLEKIVKDYLMLQHDLTAAQWLGTAYVKTGKAAEAARMMDRVMADRNVGDLPQGFVRVYWDTLLETEKYSKLKKELKSAIEEGSRPVAAVAQMLRGKIDMRKGDYRDALVEGYLRTIVLFEDVPDVQAEALFYAITCFEELGESSHAEKMRKKLLADHPKSEYSKKLQTGG